LKLSLEKSRYYKPQYSLVIGEYTQKLKLFTAKATEKAQQYFVSELISENHPSDLTRDYQVYNQKTVLQTIEILNTQEEFIITKDHIKTGL
jgi:dihydrofolate synthase/folylpolyglutamate synthase